MVKFAEFGVEAWLNRWEKQARYDISQSTIASMTLAELFFYAVFSFLFFKIYGFKPFVRVSETLKSLL